MTLRKVLTERWGVTDSHKLAVAEKHGAYEALKKVLRDKIPPAQVIAEVKSSGLRGRGGAGFPTGVKWGFVPQNTGKPIYLAVNADESEPGTNKDREIMERDPHQLIEGSILASYAINAKTAFLYIRGEFDLPLRRMEEAVAEAEQAGYLGKNILGSGVDLDFLIHRGAGAYICGEETALLTSLEGGRGEPKIKPPFPAVKGAFGCPTIVNNVESIAAVPWIMRNGAAAYSAMGTEKSKGTKVISVSGRVKKPGNYEIELGYPLRKLLYEDCGGMQDGYTLKALIPGGSSVPVIKPDVVEKLNLDYEACAAAGTLLGSAGLIVIDQTQDMVHLLTVLARFYSHESCGQCTPCREGTGWAYRVLQRIEAGEGTSRDLETLRSIATGMSGATICFLADSLAMPIQSFLKNFPEEFEAKVKKAVPA